VRHVYSSETSNLSGFDSVVLACGGDAERSLYDALSGRVHDLHVLGDAYAPRRLVFATRQAYALAKLLVGGAQ
jgi:hypothetical protein